MSYPCKINKLLQKLLEENLTGSYYFCFFPAYSFKITPEALKILVFPTPSNNPHQPFETNRLPAGNRPETTVLHQEGVII